MNKRLHKNKSYKYKLNNNGKKHKLFLACGIVLILIITITIFYFKIYAKEENQEIQTSENKENEIKPIQEIGSIIKEEKESTNETEEEKQTQQTNQENTNKEEIIYTASNGEKYSIIGKLNIPTLNIEYAILSTSSDALLKISLNRYWGAYPNEVGNMVVLGHNYKDNKFFSNLPKIKIGDIIQITDTEGQTLEYSVYDTSIIDPYDNSCTSQLTNGHTEVTLITCYYENGNPHATKRFVAKARTN